MPCTIKYKKKSFKTILQPAMEDTSPCLLFFLLLLALDTSARRLPEVAERSNNTISKLHKLTFKRRPPPLIYVEPGKRLKLTCRIRGHGGLAVSWYKDAEKIISDKLGNSSRICAMPNMLVFHSYLEEDTGNYSCLAETKNGHKARAEFTLLTEDLSSALKEEVNPIEGQETPPKWMRKYRENLYYPAGTSVKLRCHSKGNPPPHIIWKKDGKRKTEGSTLVIRKLLPRHKGEYICLAENRIGRITHKYNLHVIEVNDMVPPVIEDVMNQTVEEGSMAMFKCSVGNDKAPYIEWSRSRWPNATEGEQAAEAETTNKDNTKIFVQKKQTPDKYILYLVIQNVTVEDMGLYTCKAVNTYGKTLKRAWLSLKSDNEISDTNRFVDDPTELISGSTGVFVSARLFSKFLQQLIFSVLMLLLYL